MNAGTTIAAAFATKKKKSGTRKKVKTKTRGNHKQLNLKALMV
jgi:hypothetical protein